MLFALKMTFIVVPGGPAVLFHGAPPPSGDRCWKAPKALWRTEPRHSEIIPTTTRILSGCQIFLVILVQYPCRWAGALFTIRCIDCFSFSYPVIACPTTSEL